MDERLITQSLQAQARKDIPDNMNLIPEVTEKVGRISRTAARSRLSWVAVALLGIFAVSVVGYAASWLLQVQQLDPGLQGANEADLVTELNLSQTIDGVTLTLDYAYADANRLSIGYELSGTAPMGTSYQVVTQRLTDSAGYEYEGMFGGGGGGGGSGSEDPLNVAFSQYSTTSFDVPPFEQVPDTLDLRLSVIVNQIIGARLDDAGTPQPVEGAPQIQPLDPFEFEFTVPFISGQVVELEQSASATGTMLTLEGLVITPSLTRGRVCFAQEDYVGYAPIISLTIDGAPVDVNPEQAFVPIAEGESSNCFDLQINQSLYNLPGEWQLSVDKLVRYLSVSFSSGSDSTTADYSVMGEAEALALVRAKLEPKLEAYGIALEETETTLSFSFAMNSAIDQKAISELVTRSVREEVEGPWVFTFDVPPA